MTYKPMLETPGALKGPAISIAAWLQLVLPTFGLVLTGSAAAKSDKNNHDNQITIQADHNVQKKPAGMTYTGIPIEEVSLTRKVGFSDLDLTTPQGKAELDKRIKEVAKEACKQLEKLYPLEDWLTDTDDCVANAVKSAKAQEQTIVASAGKK